VRAALRCPTSGGVVCGGVPWGGGVGAADSPTTDPSKFSKKQKAHFSNFPRKQKGQIFGSAIKGGCYLLFMLKQGKI